MYTPPGFYRRPTKPAVRPTILWCFGFVLAMYGFSLLGGCELATVECVPDPAVGTACRCTQGPTPPSCDDLGSCLAECPS